MDTIKTKMVITLVDADMKHIILELRITKKNIIRQTHPCSSLKRSRSLQTSSFKSFMETNKIDPTGTKWNDVTGWVCFFVMLLLE